MCQSPLMYRIQSIGASGIPKPCQITPGASRHGAGRLQRGSRGVPHWASGITGKERRLVSLCAQWSFTPLFPGKRRREYEEAQRVSNQRCAQAAGLSSGPPSKKS